MHPSLKCGWQLAALCETAWKRAVEGVLIGKAQRNHIFIPKVKSEAKTNNKIHA